MTALPCRLESFQRSQQRFNLPRDVLGILNLLGSQKPDIRCEVDPRLANEVGEVDEVVFTVLACVTAEDVRHTAAEKLIDAEILEKTAVR